MDYKQQDITKRAEKSSLWENLSEQQGGTLPYLLERYLLLENWKYLDGKTQENLSANDLKYDISYLHFLLAEAATVMLSQEERIRKLENAGIK